jgi:hypothetical protein
MARSELNTVSYFPLYCDEGQKMFYIEETYGNDGFSTFIKILRELAKTEYHYLDLSKPTSLMFLSAKCKVGKELLNSIITDLVELGKFDKELWESAKIIWCQDFIDSIQDAYKKRNNNCINRNSLLELLYSKSILIQTKSNPKQSKVATQGVDNTQRKEEYRKEEKSKVFAPPSLTDVIEYFKENEYTSDSAEIAFDYYNVREWKDSKGKKVSNWKLKMQNVWFKDEYKEKPKQLWVKVRLSNTIQDFIKSSYEQAVRENKFNCDNPEIIKEYYK